MGQHPVSGSGEPFAVDCPSCRARLEVDPAARRVLRHEAPRPESARPDPLQRWDELSERVRARTAESDDRLREAFERERAREGALDELYRRQQEKLGGGPS